MIDLLFLGTAFWLLCRVRPDTALWLVERLALLGAAYATVLLYTRFLIPQLLGG